MKLNFGAGEAKLEGYVNVDLDDASKPDIVCDIRKNDMPFEKNSIEMIQMFHCIEHIEYKYWSKVFTEFWRVLEPNGMLFLAYPEFEKCAKYYLENHLGLRDLFRNTLYGRQLYAGDYHVTPMRTSEVIDALYHHGFHQVRYDEDPDEDWNTILYCYKGKMPMLRADVFKKELFKDIKPIETRFKLVAESEKIWESKNEV